MLTFLMCLLAAPAPVSPASAVPSKESVVAEFIASRETDLTIPDDLKASAIAAAREASANPETRQDAITSALKILSPEFDAALKKLAAEEAVEAGRQLTPLTTSPDPWLAAEAQLFLSRSLMVEIGRASGRERV